MLKRLKTRILEFRRVRNFINFAKKNSVPGFEGVPIYEVAYYFKDAVLNGSLSTRAASLAFNFFLALFPALIFLFTLIPYIPVQGVLDEMLLNLNEILPASVNKPVMRSLNDLINNEHEGLLIFNIILTLYFASNGIDNLMIQFNSTHLFQERRVWWKKRLIAIFLVMLLTVLLVSAILLTSLTKTLFEQVMFEDSFKNTFTWQVVNFLRWGIAMFLFYLAISSLYYFGPAKRKNWKFFSVGSSVATLLMLLASIMFAYYINNFSQYNAIYGSIGTIIIMMLYFQLTSFVLLLGFELNASVRKGGSLKS